MARVRAALQRLLDSHDPYPGIVVDRLWNSVLSNRVATLFVGALPAELLGPPTNVFRVCLHPDGLARRTLNFTEWAAYLLGQLHRASSIHGDAELQQLVEEVSAYPNVARLGDWRRTATADVPALLVPWRIDVDGIELSLFTTMTTFGTPPLRAVRRAVLSGRRNQPPSAPATAPVRPAPAAARGGRTRRHRCASLTLCMRHPTRTNRRGCSWLCFRSVVTRARRRQTNIAAVPSPSPTRVRPGRCRPMPRLAMSSEGLKHNRGKK